MDGCRRTWESARTGLCRTRQELARSLRVDAEQFLVLPQARPLEALPLCEVTACERQRRHPDGGYREAHQQRLRQARDLAADGFDEDRWQ